MHNDSGQGKSAALPAELDYWNWGAFLLNFIWCIGNNSFLALLMFVLLMFGPMLVVVTIFVMLGPKAFGISQSISILVPIGGVTAIVVLGMKGNGLAWRNKRWRDVDHFKRVQRKWAIWGAAIWIGYLSFFGALSYWLVRQMLDSEVYKSAVVQLVGNSEVIKALGAPIETGFPWGTIKTSGPQGQAYLQFSAAGPDGEGTVYLQATKDLGRWRIDRMELEVKGRPDRISMGGGGPKPIRTVPVR